MSANDDPILPKYLTQIELEYSRATGRGLQDPAIVVLDLSDKNANEIAVSVFGENVVEQNMFDARIKKVPPVALFALPRNRVSAILPHLAGIEHMEEFAADRLMTILIISHGQRRWIGAPRPNDLT